MSSAVGVVTSLFHNQLNLNFGVLQIPAGFGLLRLSQGWRIFVLFLLWLGFIVFGIGVIAIAAGAHVNYTCFPKPWNRFGREFSFVICVALIVVMIWENRVLTNTAIRRLFRLPPRP